MARCPSCPLSLTSVPEKAKKGFDTLKKLRPEGPFMNGEYWDGWFDHWGSAHASTNAQQQATSSIGFSAKDIPSVSTCSTAEQVLDG